MYYRRKLLLALLETFGGSLSDTDCNKLVFLFGRRTGRNYYDFFPHKFGAFSYVLFQDKLTLTHLGLLQENEKFQLAKRGDYSASLNAQDISALKVLSQEIGKTRGSALVRNIYLEFPYFASRSQIVEKLLSPSELKSVRQSVKKSVKPKLFTLGYEGITIDAYLNRLLDNNVHALIDVRKNPISMKYGFSKGQLRRYVENIDIAYFHLPELGVDSSLRRDLNGVVAYEKLFDYYARQILPSNLTGVEAIRKIVKEHKRVALTCFEAVHTSCHRHKITEYLESLPEFKTPIMHL